MTKFGEMTFGEVTFGDLTFGEVAFGDLTFGLLFRRGLPWPSALLGEVAYIASISISKISMDN